LTEVVIRLEGFTEIIMDGVPPPSLPSPSPLPALIESKYNQFQLEEDWLQTFAHLRRLG
jgi:hypothetical protein